MKLKEFIHKVFFKKEVESEESYSADSILNYLSTDKDKSLQFFLLLRDSNTDEIYCKFGIDQVALSKILFSFCKEDPELSEVIVSVATMLVEDRRRDLDSLLKRGVLLPKAEA